MCLLRSPGYLVGMASTTQFKTSIGVAVIGRRGLSLTGLADSERHALAAVYKYLIERHSAKPRITASRTLGIEATDEHA